MKKFYLGLLILLVVIIVFVFYPKKAIENSPMTAVPRVDNTGDKLKQDLIETFKNYRESLYKIKQFELLKTQNENERLIKPKSEVCVKAAYDIEAFIMRARLAPKDIEKKDCHKLSKTYHDILAPLRLLPNPPSSYQKRLNKDVVYFSDELKKQAWKTDDLTKKKIYFKQGIVTNSSLLEKKIQNLKISKKILPKCMTTILTHQREFLLTCKKLI